MSLRSSEITDVDLRFRGGGVEIPQSILISLSVARAPVMIYLLREARNIALLTLLAGRMLFVVRRAMRGVALRARVAARLPALQAALIEYSQ